MEKPSAITTAAIRILIIAIACFGGYLFSQTVVFGKELTSETMIVGTICSFLAGVIFHLYIQKKNKTK